jgi:hypothetical protein
MVKEIATQPIQNQKLDKLKNSGDKNSNIDFLELILQNLDNEKTSQANIVLNGNQQKNGDSKKEELVDSILEKLVNLDENGDSNFKLDLNLNLKELNLNKNLVSEIKNIINSTLKQNNILLSKQEITQFQKIDSLKELLNFANQKGLNLEKIKFAISKNLNLTNQNTQNMGEIKNSTIQSLTKQIIDKKIDNNSKKEVKNKDSQKIETTLKTDSKKVSLETILNNKTQNAKEINKNNTHKAKTDLPMFDEVIVNNKKQNVKEINKNNTYKAKTDLPPFDEVILNNKTQNVKEINKNNTHKVKTDLPMFENKIGKVIEKDKPIEKQGDSISNNSGNSNINVVSELKGKQFLAKQVIKNFNQNLDEAIKNYKPPISKIDIELNPKNLGKVEVTIIQRGNNIQVNMNSDQSNIALFQTNQADFKQALSNIGFSNIDMSFNSNQDKEKKQNQAKKSYKDNEEFEEMGEIEIQANYQYA